MYCRQIIFTPHLFPVYEIMPDPQGVDDIVRSYATTIALRSDEARPIECQVFDSEYGRGFGEPIPAKLPKTP